MIFFVENKALHHFIDAFSMMLLHSLWQGLLFAFLGGALLYLRLSVGFKYNVLLILCLVFLGTCSLTFWWYYHYDSSLLSVFTSNIMFRYNALNLVIGKILSFTTTHAKFIFILWFLCFSFCMVKIFVNLFYFDNLKNNRIVEPSQIWVEQVRQLCQMLDIRSVVHIKESAKIKVPLVLGHFKPVILFPIGLLANIPYQQAEAILLHELAHIRRNDYLVNLFQNTAEALFFFNPGFLLLSNWLRSQREHCCDDIAISYTSNVKDYLLALIDFKEHVLKNNYGPAFVRHHSELFDRVSRIIGRPYRKISYQDLCILIVSFFGLICLASLHFKSLTILTSRSVEISSTVPKQMQKPATNLNLQLQAPLKKDYHFSKKRKVVVQKKQMSISESNDQMVILMPIDTKIEERDEPVTHMEQRSSPYQATMDEYHNNIAQYNKDIAQYNKDMVQYKSDLDAYNLTIQKYNLKMKEYNKIHFPESNSYSN